MFSSKIIRKFQAIKIIFFVIQTKKCHSLFGIKDLVRQEKVNTIKMKVHLSLLILNRILLFKAFIRMVRL